MGTQEIQKTDDVRAMLEQLGDANHVAIYDKIVNQAATKAYQSQVVNRSQRVEAFKEAVAKRSRGPLAQANQTLSGFMKLVRKNADILHTDEPRQMRMDEAESVMDEALAIKKIKDVIDAEWEAVKDRTFYHMTEQFAADGDEFPEHVNGSLDVESRGYRFSREGAGRKDSELNEGALHKLVGDDVWDRITDVEVIPAQTVRKVSIQKLLDEAHTTPEVLDALERSLIVGEWKKPRLNIREL